eukprot:2098675-Rhodomonas_salina.3
MPLRVARAYLTTIGTANTGVLRLDVLVPFAVPFRARGTTRIPLQPLTACGPGSTSRCRCGSER